MGEIYIPEEVQQHAAHIVENPVFKQYLGPVKQQVINVTAELRAFDSSASVFRIAGLSFGTYLGRVDYVLLFGEITRVDRSDHKSVVVSITHDGFGTVNLSKENGHQQPHPVFNFESLKENLAILPEVLQESINKAEYPHPNSNLERLHSDLSSIQTFRETFIKDRRGNPVATGGLTHRIF